MSLTEHNFETDGVYDRVAWEDRVFDNADHFTVFRNHTQPTPTAADHRTFPAAVIDAQTDDRALLYVVSGLNRAVCVERAEWPRYLRRWASRMVQIAVKDLDTAALSGKPTRVVRKTVTTAAERALLEFGCPPNEAASTAAAVGTAYANQLGKEAGS